MTRAASGSRIAGPLVIACALTAGVGAGSLQQQKQAPEVKRVEAVPITSVDGRANYVAYCAACHGLTGKGDGPAAPAMKAPVPDLTAYAQRHGGKFNEMQVQDLIRGTSKMSTPAHGTTDMPIWGEVFRTESKERQTLRINNLMKYLQSIQAGQ